MEDGSSLSSALRSSNLLPPAECRLLAAGERSGSSEKILEDISGRLLEESEEALENTVGKVEPTMIVVSCVLVGAILLSVMLPLMNIMTAIG
jgi:type IV pilus assembly protein PilC